MRTRDRISEWIAVAGMISLLAVTVAAQDVAPPLGFQNADRIVMVGARSRAMGSAAVAASNDVTGLFANPATLAGLTEFEVRFGGEWLSQFNRQTQEWHPNRLYAELSLLLENRMDGIIDRPANPTGSDTSIVALKHAYDDLGPNWSRRETEQHPKMAAAAMPFAFGNDRLVLALGYGEVLNLNSYFQNNNALTPNVGQMRPAPIFRLTSQNDSLPVDWQQYIAKREGSVYGFTPSIAVGIGEHFRVGMSVSILNGTTDDREDRNERGRITLRANSASTYNIFSVDSIASRLSKVGTSTFTGSMVNLGLLWKTEAFAAGISFKPPYTLKRNWQRTVSLDSMGTSSRYNETGIDMIDIPMNSTFGLALYPSQRIVIALDYELRQYGKAKALLTSDTTVHPWVNSQLFRVGLEYNAAQWLNLRFGYREDVQSFAPAGAAILDDPVRGSVYTAGFGIDMRGWQLNVAYEFGQTKYFDAWESNVNYHTRETMNVVAEIGYRF